MGTCSVEVLGWRRVCLDPAVVLCAGVEDGECSGIGDQWVLWGEQSNAESLPLHHPTGHACTIAASCVQIFLNDFEGQNQFSKGRKEGYEGPSLISLSL